jgi:amidase
LSSQTTAVSSTFEPDAFKLEEATIAGLQSAMARQEISATTLVGEYIARIEQFDPQLNAFICLNPRALEIAAQLDAERAKGALRGPLHGIPIVLKDNINTAELPTTGGCVALKRLQPTADAFVVARLREAGAIVLGKTNLHELACSGETISALGGQTHNPYHLDYTPGGSSGGTAAAVAANLAVAGLGSDTFNSVRSPASACSLVGLRPTTGLVSRDGLMPVSLTQDVIGPMARTVTDVAVLLDVIATDDPQDPMTARSAGQRRGSYQRALTQRVLKKVGLRGMRLGIVPSLWGQDEPHAQVNAITKEAIVSLKALGAQTQELAVNIDIDQMIAELSLNVLEGKLHFEKYLESLGKAAPVKTLQSLLKSGTLHPSIEPLIKQMQAVESPLGDDEYWQRRYARRAELRQILSHIFQHYRLDALLYPHQRQLVAPIGQTQQERNGFLAAASGFPAITLPAGFSKAGLPVGIELMAMPFQEAKLLQMAYAYEQKTQWRRPPELSA